MLWTFPAIATSSRSNGNGYTYSRSISIDYTKVPNTDQTDFPLSFVGTYDFLRTTTYGGFVQNASGYDVIFTSDSGGLTKLKHETVRYSATTGNVEYHVKIPTLSHTSNTIIYIWYGNSSISSDQSDKNNVWDTYNKAVWHLQDTITAASQTASDSSSNALNLTSTVGFGSWGVPCPVDAQLGGGAEIDIHGGSGYDNSFRFTGPNLTGTWTISAWAKITTTPAGGNILFGDRTNAGPSYCHWFGTNFRATINGSDKITSTNATSAGVWKLYHITRNGTALKLYENGALVTSNSNGFDMTFDAIGERTGDAGSNNMIYDEVKISNTDRSADWIATEYNNQNSPQTFYTVSNYNVRRIITIDYTKVPNTDQTDFPLMIMGTYPFLRTVANGGYVTNSNGYDIIFASDAAGTTLLKWETVYYKSATGEVKYFVKIPTLSHTANTTIYMLCGNAAITTDQSDKTNTWDSSFYSVLHFGDGTTLSYVDSKGTVTYTNNAVAAGAGITGLGAASFNGSSAYLDGGVNAFGITGDLTINLWSNATNVVSILSKNTTATDKANPLKFGYYGGTNKMALFLGNGTTDTASSSSTLQAASTWTHIGVKMSGTSYTFFYNGATDGTGTNSNARADSTSYNARIGTNSLVGSEFYAGLMDELWISTTARSNDWMATVYNNQKSPETFYSITPTGYLLDKFPAKYAYSLRKLKTGATNAIRVNRSSDSTEQDIGFDSNGDFDIASYNTFVGGGIGRVVKWYDQSGNSNHFLTNGVMADCPVFTTGIFNTRVGMKWNGTTAAMYSTNNPFLSATTDTKATVFQVCKIPEDPSSDGTGNKTGPFFACNGWVTTDNHLPWIDSVIYDSTFSTTRKTVGDPTPLLTNNSLLTIISGPSDWRYYLNNTLLYSTTTNTFDGGVGHTGVAWLGVTNITYRWFPGWGAEIIVYDKVISDSDRNLISENINDYYTII